MDSPSNEPNRLTVRGQQDCKAELKTSEGSVSRGRKTGRQVTIVFPHGGHATGRQGCTITVSGLSVRHIIALSFVFSSVAWFVGAITALVLPH